MYSYVQTHTHKSLFGGLFIKNKKPSFPSHLKASCASQQMLPCRNNESAIMKSGVCANIGHISTSTEGANAGIF